MKHFEQTAKRFDLFEMLKRETTTVHEKVMDELWAQRMLSDDYTRVEYSELLQKYYGYYLPLETLLLALPVPVFQPSRAKHSLLKDDLGFLTSHQPIDPVICRKLPEVDSVPSALGICYVLEGATLGGQMIAKKLKISLGLPHQEGLKFFSGYGSETGKMWNSFKAHTRNIVCTPKESAVMLEAALNTFNSLSDWMEAT